MLMGSIGSQGKGYGGGFDQPHEPAMEYASMQPMSGYGAMMHSGGFDGAGSGGYGGGGGGGGGGRGRGGYAATSQDYSYQMLPISGNDGQDDEQDASGSSNQPAAVLNDNVPLASDTSIYQANQQDKASYNSIPDEMEQNSKTGQQFATLTPLNGKQLEATFQLPDRRK